MKVLIAVALWLGIFIGFGIAMAVDAPRQTLTKSRSTLEIRCVPWAPDSAALAKKHCHRMKFIT